MEVLKGRPSERLGRTSIVRPFSCGIHSVDRSIAITYACVSPWPVSLIAEHFPQTPDRFRTPPLCRPTQGNFSTATGSMTLIMMILGRFIFQRFGWTTAALVTPTVLALTGAGFFSLILFEGTFAPVLSFFGTTPLMAAVFVGAAQVLPPSLPPSLLRLIA